MLQYDPATKTFSRLSENRKMATANGPESAYALAIDSFGRLLIGGNSVGNKNQVFANGWMK